MCQKSGWYSNHSTMMSTSSSIFALSSQFFRIISLRKAASFFTLIALFALMTLVPSTSASAQHSASTSRENQERSAAQPSLTSSTTNASSSSVISIRTSTIQGNVWHDINHDGFLIEAGRLQAQSATIGTDLFKLSKEEPIVEEPIADVEVLLYQVEVPSGRPGRGEQPQQLRLVDSVNTSSTGSYIFSGVESGEYIVEFGSAGLPVGHRISPKGPHVESSVPNATQIATNVDPGTRRSAQLVVDDNAEPISINMGVWLPVSVGNRVWLDRNGNGIQEPEETGIPDVDVRLYTIDSDGILSYTSQTATTDANGFYSFGDLVPNIYLVEFALPDAVGDHRPTRQNRGVDDALDSDLSDSSLLSEPTPFLTSGSSDSTLDLGLTQTVRIGNLVWEDIDGDGYQDEDESGLGGISIQLRDPDGAVVAETESGRDGGYLFYDVLPGSYYITVTSENRQLSPFQIGRYDASDSDIDPASGKSPLFSILSGNSLSNIDVGLLAIAEPMSAAVMPSIFIPLR